MASPHSQYPDQNVKMVTSFIETKAPRFHDAFAVPTTFNPSTMTYQYEPPEIKDLREILEYHQQKARKYVDFTNDLTNCTWDQVHAELQKAQRAVLESERRGKNPIRRAFRALGNTSSILAPGLSALPDDLCILHGALALIFSLARHSELNRVKILGAFENVPNIIEMARNKAQTFPLDSNNPKSVQLHTKVRQLQETLIKSLPPLINKLVPSGFVASLQRPFGGWNIDRILEEVKTHADSVRICADGLIEDLIVGNYSASMTIKSQLDEILQQNRMIYMSLDAASQGKTHLFTFLMDQLNLNTNGGALGMGYYLPPNHGRSGSLDQTDLISERGTALPGYTPEDLLKIMDVSHLRIIADESHVLRRSNALPTGDLDHASRRIMSAPAVKELINVTSSTSSPDDQGPGPGVVSIEGHFDRNQITQVTPLSYICAVLSQALRQQAEQQNYLYTLQYSTSTNPTSPVSPTTESPTTKPPLNPNPTIVLTYFCALHTSPDDPLSGPQGLLRCLTTQLLYALLQNELVNPSSPLDLPHLSSSSQTPSRETSLGTSCLSEEDLLVSLDMHALSRLFSALINTLPSTIPIFIIIDSLSSYERDQLDSETGGSLRKSYEAVLEALISAMDAGNLDTGGNCVRILVTSPTRGRWLFNEAVGGGGIDGTENSNTKEGLGLLHVGLEGYLLPGGRISLRGMGLGHGPGPGPGLGLGESGANSGTGLGLGRKLGRRFRGVGVCVPRASTLPVSGSGMGPATGYPGYLDGGAGMGGIDGMMDGGAGLDRGYQMRSTGVGEDTAESQYRDHGYGQGQQQQQQRQGQGQVQGWREGHDRRSSA